MFATTPTTTVVKATNCFTAITVGGIQARLVPTVATLTTPEATVSVVETDTITSTELTGVRAVPSTDVILRLLQVARYRGIPADTAVRPRAHHRAQPTVNVQGVVRLDKPGVAGVTTATFTSAGTPMGSTPTETTPRKPDVVPAPTWFVQTTTRPKERVVRP